MKSAIVLNTGRAVGALALMLTVASQARADLVIEYSSLVTGTNPSGAGPWLRATFVDVGAGVVELKLENLLQLSSEFISDVYFNIDPAFGETGWSFTHLAGQAVASAPVVEINSYNGPGSGKFDLDYAYGTANNSERFTMGEISQYRIEKAGLTSASFWFPSTKGEYTVAHVQGIPAGVGSGTLRGGPAPVVPAPGASLLVMLGIGVVGALRRRLA